MLQFSASDYDVFWEIADEWVGALGDLEDWAKLRILFALAVQEQHIAPNEPGNSIRVEIGSHEIEVQVQRDGRNLRRVYPLREILRWEDEDRHVEGYARALLAIVEKANTDLARSALPA